MEGIEFVGCHVLHFDNLQAKVYIYIYIYQPLTPTYSIQSDLFWMCIETDLDLDLDLELEWI